MLILYFLALIIFLLVIRNKRYDKKKIIILFLSIIIFLISVDVNIYQIEVIYVTKKYTDTNVSMCKVVKKNEREASFLGDGMDLYVFECDNKVAKDFDNVKWKKLPFTEDLETLMYGGEKNGISYGYEFAIKYNIPHIENGYYYFRDKNNKYTADNFLDSEVLNFQLIIYDSDTHLLYYFEFDT